MPQFIFWEAQVLSCKGPVAIPGTSHPERSGKKINHLVVRPRL